MCLQPLVEVVSFNAGRPLAGEEPQRDGGPGGSTKTGPGFSPRSTCMSQVDTHMMESSFTQNKSSQFILQYICIHDRLMLQSDNLCTFTVKSKLRPAD